MKAELHKTEHFGKLTKKAIEYIIQQIVNDVWPPGMRVVESDLTETLGLSRTTVRTAIGILIGKGELTQTSKGVIVTRLNPKELWDLIEVRKSIEISAVRLATIRASQPQLKQLIQIDQEMEKHLREGALLKYIDGNFEFHLKIAEASGNLRFCTILEEVNMPTIRYRYRALLHQGQSGSTLADYKSIIDEHKAIIMKMEEKDEIGAAEAMEIHINKAMGRWSRIYLNSDYFTENIKLTMLK